MRGIFHATSGMYNSVIHRSGKTKFHKITFKVWILYCWTILDFFSSKFNPSEIPSQYNIIYGSELVSLDIAVKKLTPLRN